MNLVSPVAGAWIREMRVKHWTKNVFVLSIMPYLLVPFNFQKILDVGIMFVAFCCAASSIYLCNDLLDVEKDRKHPTKYRRPIAAGVISIREALIAAIGLTILSLVLSFKEGEKTLILVFLYLCITHSYSFWGKHIPFVDVSLVGILYGIRVLGGTFAADIKPSGMLYWVTLASLLALFIELGKRYAEFRTVGPGETRKVLASYSETKFSIFFAILAIAILAIYLVATWQMVPWFSLSTILVGPALYLFHRAIRKLEEDTHPLEVIMAEKWLCGIVVVFGVSFMTTIITR